MGALGALRIVRPGNAAMAAVGVLVGMTLVAAPLRHPALIWAAPLAAALAAAAGNVLNDLRDEAVDRRAHPRRPLVAGSLRRPSAWALAGLCAAGALAAVALPPASDTRLVLFVAATLALLVLYELALKARGLAGNLLVALLTAATFAFGAAATTASPDTWGTLWILAAMAFFANVAREVAKDMEDRDADYGHRRTLAHALGRNAAFVVMGASAAAVAVSVGWLLALHLLGTPLAALLGADLVILVAAALSGHQPHAAQAGLKLGMLLALGVFLANALS